jgi:hypothetical protein
MFPLVSAAQEPPAGRSDTDPDFSGKVIYLVTKPKDAKSECGYGVYEKVRVTRLADRAFLVGVVPDFGEGEIEKAAAGKKVWTPISDIVQLSEFSTLDEAKRYFEAARKEGGQTGR